MVDLWNQPARHRTALPTVPARLIPGLEPWTRKLHPAHKQKRRVSR